MHREPFDITLATWLRQTERWVQRDGDTSSAGLRCRYEAPVEKVWAACTDSAKLRRWLAEVSGEVSEGATLTLDVGAPQNVTSRILRWEPPRRLVFTWSYPGREVDQVEIRLTPDDDATVLELEQHSQDKTDWWLGAGAGWESALMRLALLLQGADPRQISDAEFDATLGPIWTDVAEGRPQPDF
jgi:uncharacterized protein YndB with AHSA1/START domain